MPVNVKLLIDGIVRQTMVLIAQLATSGGLRAPLAHVAGQAFLELARELEGQGVPKKVSADMFGMALRTYQRRTQRLSQSRTDRGRSLWEAVLEYIEQGGVVTREAVLARFRFDDETSLRGVLRDLRDSSLVFASGSGKSRAYRVATSEELLSLDRGDDRAGLEAYAWTLIYREGETSMERLVERTALERGRLEPVIASLLAAGRIERVVRAEGELLRARELVLGFEDAAGWEASVLDHFSTAVQTVACKLSLDQKANAADEVGGSTYHFKLWRGHPLEQEVVGELARFRRRMSDLRQRVDAFNASQERVADQLTVHAYYGQWLTEEAYDDIEEHA